MRAVVVEPEAVDQRLVLRKTPHPRLRVAGLGVQRDRAGLYEPEAELVPVIQRQRVLIEPCREPERIREIDAEQRLREPRVVKLPRLEDAPLERGHRDVVHLLRVEQERRRPDHGLVKAHGPLLRASRYSFSLLTIARARACMEGTPLRKNSEMCASSSGISSG